MRSFASYTITLLLGAACYAAPQPMQRAFATPQEAAQALVDAAAKNDTVALLRPFGPSGGDIVESGDAVQDKARRADFGRRAGEELEIETEPSNPNRATVVVGQESWPLRFRWCVTTASGASTRPLGGWRCWRGTWAAMNWSPSTCAAPT